MAKISAKKTVTKKTSAASTSVKKAVKKTAEKTVKVSAKTKTSKKISQTELMKHIADRAYYIWMESGRPEGCDYDNWKRAEAEIKAAYNVK